MNNKNENPTWVKDPSSQEKIKLPSGRTVKDVKQDAKKFKKINNVSHHVSLEVQAEKNGLGCLWNDFVLRSKELIGMKSSAKESKLQDYCKDTLIMGDTGTGADRLANELPTT